MPNTHIWDPIKNNYEFLNGETGKQHKEEEEEEEKA
jgi:hypothetical protein